MIEKMRSSVSRRTIFRHFGHFGLRYFAAFFYQFWQQISLFRRFLNGFGARRHTLGYWRTSASSIKYLCPGRPTWRSGASAFWLNHGRQRGIYLTFGDACVIISICKAYLRHQMCPKRLPEEHQTNVPFVRRRHLWRVGPSTRGATAPQGAQQVNFVVGCGLTVVIKHVSPWKAKHENLNKQHLQWGLPGHC